MRSNSAIKRATTDDELAGVYRLRYEIYVREMKRNAEQADHRREWLTDHLDCLAHNFVAIEDEAFVATARWNFAKDGRFGDYEQLYQLHRFQERREQLGIITRLMVLKKHRGSGIAISLTGELYRYGLERGLTLAVSDCNSHLLSAYERLGWRTYMGTIEHPDYGNVTPIVFEGHDVAHLRRVRSPFLPIYEKWAATQPVAAD